MPEWQNQAKDWQDLPRQRSTKRTLGLGNFVNSKLLCDFNVIHRAWEITKIE